MLNPSNGEDVDKYIHESERIHPMSDPAMNGLFIYNELKVVVKNAKRKNAAGFNEIPVDV